MIKNTQKYKSILDLKDTELAIKYIKDNFERELSEELNLMRVSAPLFVLKKSGLNDNLSGVERPVSFNTKYIDGEIEIVQSLAKWKRQALKKYDIKSHKGLYTDMNAIRRDEDTIDNIHSIYVDQWDYELVIDKEQRNLDTLKDVVKRVFKVLKDTEKLVNTKYPSFKEKLPKDIFFISSEELVKLYPNKTSKEREYLITKEKKAVFIIGIGYPLSDGRPHDLRAADYDDWDLNGDILVYDEVLDIALELSSMGIRVSEESIVKQLKFKGEDEKIENSPFVKDVINKNLPYTLGGGIGQSRICMFLLEKAHIGEVQSSIWSDEDIEKAKEMNIFLL